ncbi:glycoside hydrolase family 43 protein [Roseateles oligotrophus]|uniref:Glycoside hydrolase family 43 protein n=1 Tax=Roseateles oligotrophus TaxID=1769250 RepID=A0ABT2YHP1_9BURK|nr:glycoside hydrolase family 43 protein [Roseateles oligotrophus]MCV2369590.1 glycoside hydrolase family 43 protein [Roseateles oligotrophus]
MSVKFVALLALALACLLEFAPPARAANPIFPKLFTADPVALSDGGRVYAYVGVDEAKPDDKDYVMNEWRVYSSCDMRHWVDHGSPIQAKTFAWAKGRAWAAHVVKQGNKYYFYSTVEHATVPGLSIGVAVSDSPTGPFVDARGTALITNDMTKQTDIHWDDIDPAVFVDDDGSAHLYWGNTFLKYARLKPNMTELDGDYKVMPVEPFTEAAYMHKRGATYYLSYSQGFPEETAYQTGPSPTGPWMPRGVIMAMNSGVKTIHTSIIDFNGKSYIFYHNAKLPGGSEFRRSVAVEELHYRADGTIVPIEQTLAGPKANPSPGCKVKKK